MPIKSWVQNPSQKREGGKGRGRERNEDPAINGEPTGAPPSRVPDNKNAKSRGGAVKIRFEGHKQKVDS